MSKKALQSAPDCISHRQGLGFKRGEKLSDKVKKAGSLKGLTSFRLDDKTMIYHSPRKDQDELRRVYENRNKVPSRGNNH